MSGDHAGSSETTKEPVIEGKLKILCLHGYRQNAETFKSKLGAFRKQLKKYADFTFISAPHKAPPLEGSSKEEENGDQRSWWFNKDDGTFKGTNVGGPAIGFQESLKLVEKAWEEQGPFDGLLGFSQGACFVALLCSISAKNFTTVKPNFVILISGFRSGSLVHNNFQEEESVLIPSLHVYGESDDIIPGNMSELLAKNFSDPTILKHPGGHYCPATAKEKSTYINFFEIMHSILRTPEDAVPIVDYE